MENNNWISVKERLPEKDSSVLVFCKPVPIKYPNGIFIGYLDVFSDEDLWIVDGTQTETKSVTHWMPLPNKP